MLARLDGLERKVALLIGEPGMGKSLLAAAWADRRRKAGRRAIFVEADGPGLVAPLAPLRRAVAALLHLEDPPSDAKLRTLGEVNVEDLAGLTEDQFRAMFQTSPIQRAKYAGFLRNVTIAMGNSKLEKFRQPLETLAGFPNPLVSEHARWALSQLSIERERDPVVS